MILGEVIVASESEREVHREPSIETAFVDALLEARGHLTGLPDAEIVVVLQELAARRRVLDAALVEVAGELLRREDESPRAETVSRKAGFRNLPAMLEQVLGVPFGQASTLVGVAGSTRERMTFTGECIPPKYPEVSRALGAGLVSVAQASAITKGLDRTGGRVDVVDLDRAECELVASACGLNPEDEQPAVPKVLEVQAAMWVSYLDPDGVEPRAEKIAEERGLWISRRADGAVAGKFVATPEAADLLISVLDAVLSPRRPVEFRAATECGEPLAPTQGPTPGAGELPLAPGEGRGGRDSERESELEGLRDGPCDGGRENPELPLMDSRSIEQKRIDALEMIVRCYAESPDAPRTGGEAPTIVIVTTRRGLAGNAESPEDLPHLEHTGQPVPPSFAAQVICDGFIRISTRDTNGEILNQGRKQRLFTPVQRRAIAVRDRQCRAPGCSAPVRWCEVHHAVPWSQGGPTDVRDGVLLCSFHHHEVHRGRLVVLTGNSGRWNVVPALGHQVPRRTVRRRGYPVAAISAHTGHPQINRSP